MFPVSWRVDRVRIGIPGGDLERKSAPIGINKSAPFPLPGRRRRVRGVFVPPDCRSGGLVPLDWSARRRCRLLRWVSVPRASSASILLRLRSGWEAARWCTADDLQRLRRRRLRWRHLVRSKKAVDSAMELRLPMVWIPALGGGGGLRKIWCHSDLQGPFCIFFFLKGYLCKVARTGGLLEPSRVYVRGL